MFYVVDADTGYGLKGAEFSLFQRDELVFGSYSNRSGAVWFLTAKKRILSGNSYE